MISLGGNKTSSSKIVKKADDRFEINSQLGKQINQFWNYAVYLNFKSQLLPGFRYYKEEGVEKKDKSTRIFSPTIMQLGVGWYYKKKSRLEINDASKKTPQFLEGFCRVEDRFRTGDL